MITIKDKSVTLNNLNFFFVIKTPYSLKGNHFKQLPFYCLSTQMNKFGNPTDKSVYDTYRKRNYDE